MKKKLLRRLLLLLGPALIILLVTDVGPAMFTPYRMRLSQLQAIRADLQTQAEQLAAIESQADELRGWAAETLPLDESQASAVYYPFLTATAAAAGLEHVTITPSGSSDEAAAARWLTLNVTAEATSLAWADFLQRLQAVPLMQRIASWELTESEGTLLRVHFTVEVACLEGSRLAAVPTLSEVPQSPAGAFASRDWFGKQSTPTWPQYGDTPYTAARDERDEGAPANVPTPVPPLQLVGLLTTGPRVEAWFYDASSHRNQVLTAHSQFQIANRSGSVLDIDATGVTLLLQGQTLRLALGEMLLFEGARFGVGKAAESSPSPTRGDDTWNAYARDTLGLEGNEPVSLIRRRLDRFQRMREGEAVR
jgi:hypothetical protein